MIKFFSNFSKVVPRATSYLLYLIIALIPFSIRYVFDTPWNFQTGAYSDFTSLSIYMSDIVILALILITVVFHMKQRLPKYWLLASFGLVVWLIMELLLQSQDLLPLQTYFSIRLFILICFATIVCQIDVSREKIALLFTGLGVVQSLIGLIQFISQKSLGLYFFGESSLNPEILGVAKIVAHGTKMIRAYGTLPHPNLLAAFLVVAIGFNLYLLTRKYQAPRGILIYITLFINIFGLFLTFSRGGILAFTTVFIIISLIYSIKRQFQTTWKLALPVILGIAVSFSILQPYLLTRATVSDDSTKQRLFYNEIGKEMISNNLPLGVGAGLSVLHMKQYTSQYLEAWEIQPIHNYYLITLAELGIGATLLFLLILIALFSLYKRRFDHWSATLLAVWCGLLVLFLFDHYFYTIWPTQVLLWLLIGLSLQSISRETLENT